MVWGTMMPTKAMSPLTATAAAVANEAATTTTRRVRSTGTPRVVASWSPTLSTSSSRRWASNTAPVTTAYGSTSVTWLHPVTVSRPRSQVYTSLITLVSRCWTNVCMAVSRLATATPARINDAVDRARSPVAPTVYVTSTAPKAPTKAASGTGLNAEAAESPDTMAIVAPSPAPAATPSSYGAANGLRKTPWYDAPAMASMAPTKRPSTTRGSRSSQMIRAC